MNETTVTVQGNIATDVVLRRTRSGHEVASFRLASTPRKYDKQADQWVDGQPAFYTVSCWRALARNVAESLAKGVPVVVHGRLTQRMYEREVGDQTVRSYASDIDALSLGPDLRFGVAEFRRAKSQALRLAEARARSEAERLVAEGPASTVGVAEDVGVERLASDGGPGCVPPDPVEAGAA